MKFSVPSQNHSSGRGIRLGLSQIFMLSRNPTQWEDHVKVSLSPTSCFKKLRELIGESNHGLVALGVKKTAEGQCRTRRSTLTLGTRFHSTVKFESRSVSQSCPPLCDPMDCGQPGHLSLEFSRQEYFSGFPFPSLGDLLNPGI